MFQTQFIIATIPIKCMDRVVRVYKQALFRNHGLLSSIPQFTLERSWPTMRINSRVNFRKTPEIPTLCAARVCPSTPHSVTSNQGGQVWCKCYSGGSERIAEQRMDCLCTGQTWIVVDTCSAYFGGARPDWVASFWLSRIPEQHIYGLCQPTYIQNIYRLCCKLLIITHSRAWIVSTLI